MLQDNGDQQIFWGWQDAGDNGWGAYGEVQIEEELLISYLADDHVCPYTG